MSAIVKFQMPDELHKDLSPTSQKIYKTRLNTLARAGYPTVDALLSNKTKVIAVIKEAVSSVSQERMVARQYISAISWVCGKDAMGANNAYQKYYQTVLPKETSDGDRWLKKNKFQKKTEQGTE